MPEPDITQTVEPQGFTGIIAHVDLSDGRIWYDRYPAAWYRDRQDADGIGAWYMAQEARPGTDPLGRDTLLVVCATPVADSAVPASAPHSTHALAPRTGVATVSHAHSPFGPALNRSGLDAVIFHGRTVRPCYAILSLGKVELKDASLFWGMSAAETHDALLCAEGEDAHTATIGSEGEALLPDAPVVHDAAYEDSRQGAGSAMGAKNIKALVAIPDSPLPTLA